MLAIRAKRGVNVCILVSRYPYIADLRSYEDVVDKYIAAHAARTWLHRRRNADGRGIWMRR